MRTQRPGPEDSWECSAVAGLGSGVGIADAEGAAGSIGFIGRRTVQQVVVQQYCLTRLQLEI